MTKDNLLQNEKYKWKPTAHSGTFGFARHKSQRFAKPKEPSFSQRTDRPLKIQTLYIMKFDIKTLF